MTKKVFSTLIFSLVALVASAQEGHPMQETWRNDMPTFKHGFSGLAIQHAGIVYASDYVINPELLKLIFHPAP